MRLDVGRQVNTLVLPCIDCLAPLPDPPWSCTSEYGQVFDDVTECESCGLRYSGEILRYADPETWAYAALNRLFCHECDPSGTAVTIHTAERGVIACPTHGPAPRRG